MPITDLATNVILDNVGKVYFLKTGVYRDQVGLDNNHPLSSVSALLIHIEDGVPQNVMVANYAPSKMASWASHDFPLWYRGQVEYTITGESSPRTFAQYFTYVPSILVAMNKNGTSIMDVNVTITQSTGANLLGGFADLTALNNEYPLTDNAVALALQNDLTTAYVYDNVVQNSAVAGFYNVVWNVDTSIYEWVRIDQALVRYGVQTKQYNVLPIKVQRGFAPNQTPLTVSDEVVRLIYQEIAYVNAVIANHTELIDDLELEVINNFQALKSLLGIATENDWNFEGELPSDVKFPNSRNGWCQVGSDFYVFGGSEYIGTDLGFTTDYCRKAYKYNAVTKEWTELSDLPINMDEQRCVEKDGYIYIMCGGKFQVEDLDKYYKYEIATDTYTLIANPPDRIRNTSGAVLIDDNIYIMVDSYYTPGEPPITSIYINTTPYVYNITTDTWTAVGTPANTRFDRGFSYYYEGKIYVQRSLKFQSYDPVTDTWDETLTPPTYGLVHTGLMHEYRGRLFIGSGWESAQSKNTPYIQYYNVSKDKWFTATRLEVQSHALGYGSMFMYNNKLYYLGGYSNDDDVTRNVVVRSFNLEKLQLDRVDALYEQVYDLEDRMDTAEEDIDDLETFQNVTVPATYETIANANTHRGRTTALENANMVKSIAVVGTNLFTITFYDDTTSNILTLAQLKTFIGNATNALSGLMTAQHVTDLEMLMALFDGDGDAVVNTIAEVLAIFEDYPEGVDLVTALAGKVDKTTTIAGVDLQNNITKEELQGALDVDDKVDKVIGKSLVEDTEITKLQDLDTQAQTDAKFDLKLDKDISTLELYNIVDTDLFFKRSADGTLQKITAQQAKDYFVSAGLTFDATVNYMTNGLGAFKSAVTMIHPVTLQTNGDFRCSIRAIETNTFIYVLFPTITATNTLRVSTNNGTNYYNVLKNGSTMRASIVSGQLVRLQFNGTNFIADIQSDVEVSETYTTKLNSTFGKFAPLDKGLPIVKEIQGRTIPTLENLVTNGDFATDTEWTKTNMTISGGKLVYNSTSTGYSTQTGLYFILDNVYYVTFNLNLISRVSGDYGLRVGNIANYQFVTSTTLGKQIVKGSFKRTGETETGHLFGAINSGNGNAEFDNLHIFNLTTLYGVTATSGTAYDNAVADIEAQLEANGGYISTTDTTHVENSEFKSVGKNLFDGMWESGSINLTTGVNETNVSLRRWVNYISVSPSTQYTISRTITTSASGLRVYDVNYNYIGLLSGMPSGTANITFTTQSNARYIRAVDNNDTTNANQLEQGTVATTYAPYNTETQLFNHGALRSTIDKSVRDKIRYLNGAYVKDVYINSADNTALATPLLATEVVDVDGTLIQESTTTVEQLQNIPASVTIEYSMDVEQTTKTLVDRDKLQQLEIDTLETRTTALEARKTVSHNVIYMSATAWSTYTRVDGEVYGVWNESTGVITMYYGTVGA